MVLPLKVSRIGLVLGVFVVSCVFAAPLQTGLDFFAILIIEIALLCSCLISTFYVGNPAKRIQQIGYNGSSWQLLRGTESLEVAAPTVVFFSEHLIIIDFISMHLHAGQRYRLLIYSDSMEPSDYCHFRRFLRFDNETLE